MTTFSQIKEHFYGRFPDLTVFDCRPDLNVVKCALEAAQFIAQGFKFPYDTHLVWSPAAFVTRGVLSALRRPSAPVPHEVRDRSVMFAVDVSRATTVDGRVVSTYFHRLATAIPAAEQIVVTNNRAWFTGWGDYEVADHRRSFPGPEMIALKRDLLDVHRRVAATGLLSQPEGMAFQHALARLHAGYGGWISALRAARPRTLGLLCHYHKEGLIYAARSCGVRVVEFQHGLIDRNDIFYSMPSAVRDVRARALFPDTMLTYGPYWSGILREGHEFAATSIDEIGYYLQPDSSIDEETRAFCTGAATVMVATQPRTADACRAYIAFLIDRHRGDDGVRILIRSHPAEGPRDYEQFAAEPNVRIANRGGIDRLLPLVRAVVSVYSTVLFDAIRHGIPSYAVHDPAYADYIGSISATHAIRFIDARQSPFDSTPVVPDDPGRFYLDFRPDVLERHLLAAG